MFGLTRKEVDLIKTEVQRAKEQTRGFNIEYLVVSRLPDKMMEEKELEVRMVIYEETWR